MTYLKTLTRVAGVGLCVVAFAGTALAGNGNENGNGNGNGGTPPGQEKKAEPAPAPAATPAPAPQAAAPAQENKAESHARKAEKQAGSKPAAKPSAGKATAPGQAKKAAKAAQKSEQPAKAATSSKGQSANAHHHVIVCHRTGSLSNPYVVINIPYTAWLHAHSDTTGSHPDLNGNHDKMLKDPASRPGSKDGFTKAACGGAAVTSPTTQTTQVTPAEQSHTSGCPATTSTTEQVLVGVWHATGAYKNGKRKYVYITPSLNSAHYDKTKHSDDIPVYEDRAMTVAASADSCTKAAVTPSPVTPPPSSLVVEQPQPIVPTAAGQAPASGTIGVLPAATAKASVGGVAGAVSPANAAAGQSQPAGGVLGAVASAPKAVAQTAGSGTLPFTGIPLWIAALVGGALLASGLVLRRSAS
jgi:hypothetical protein